MSNNPYFTAEPPPPPPPRGRRLWVWLAGGCGLSLLLCCGGAAFIFYYAASWFQDSVSEDAGTIEERKRQITAIEIPADFKPTFSMDMHVPISGQYLATWVMYADQPSGSTLMLAEFSETLTNEKSRGDIQVSITKSFREKGGEPDDVMVQHSREVKTTVRGKPAEFIIANGKHLKTKAEVWQVNGHFQGQRGPAVLLLNASAEKYTEAQIEAIVNSIK